MSRILGVVFSESDIPAIRGFAAAVGLPYDLVMPVGSGSAGAGAGAVFAGSLSEFPLEDALAQGVSGIAQGYSHIVAASSMASKAAMARLAGKLRIGMVTDVIGVESPSRFTRPIVAGTIIATVEVAETPVVLTFRASAFPKVEAESAPEVKSIEFPASRVKQVSKAAASGGRPDLTQAKVVVSGGRPLKDAATFESVIGGLADALGGAAGATRAAVDSGIAPNELQVGQTGKIVAPDLYIAAGISGSTQHMAGIKDSKLIVAINKDPDAPIFDIADLGLVADLFVAIPEIQSQLK